MRFFPLMILMLIGCHSKVFLSDEECQNMKRETSPRLEKKFNTQYPIFEEATFNPLNPNEIIVVQRLKKSRYGELLKYNLKNMESFVLSDSITTYIPNWSKENKVLYFTLMNKLVNINIQNNEKNILQYHKNYLTTFSNSTFIDRFGFIYSQTGNILDTLISDESNRLQMTLGYKNAFALSKNNLGAFCGQKLLIIDVLDKKLIYEEEQRNMKGGGVSWFPNSKRIVWVNLSKGLYLTDLKTKKTKLIRKNCDNRRYSSPSVSSNGKYIICTREDFNLENLNVQKNICIMRTNGKEEKIIKFK